MRESGTGGDGEMVIIIKFEKCTSLLQATEMQMRKAAASPSKIEQGNRDWCTGVLYS